MVSKFPVLSGISGCARFLWSLGVLVFYRFKAFRPERDHWGLVFYRRLGAFRFERDLQGCSFPIVSILSVLSGISGGGRFLWFQSFLF